MIGETRPATLVLISRTGDGIPGDAELARISAGRELEVILAIAPWRPSAHTRPHAGTLIFPPGAAWGDVVAECARIASHDRMAFVELPAVRSLARIPELLDELDHADIAGARLLRLDGVTLESGGGGFNASRLVFSLDSGAIASTLPEERTQVLWVDRRAFAARRDALLLTGPPHESVGDVLAEADWGWRLSTCGYRLICSPIVIPIDEGIQPTPRSKPLHEEGERVRAGTALLATMLEQASLHKVLAQNPAAAAHSRSELPPASCASPSPICANGGQRRRRHARATTTTSRNASARRSTSTARRPSRASRDRSGARRRPRVAILCSDVVGDGLAGPAIRALESARVLGDAFDVQIGVRDATAAIDCPLPGAPAVQGRGARAPRRVPMRSCCKARSASGTPRSSPRTCRSRSTSTTR